MTNAILEREFDIPLSREDFGEMAARSGGCFGLHAVDWQHSMLAAGGRKLICWFQSRDLESVRIVLRSDDGDISDIWPGVEMSMNLWSGTVHDAPDADVEAIRTANVVVERRWDEPVALEDIQAIEDAGASCLEMRNVRFLRTFFANDRKRMLCLYSAPDAESVRQAQHEAGMPVENVWSFERLENTTDDKTLA
jgi:hypothetical protein